MEDSKNAWKEYGLTLQKKKFSKLRNFWDRTTGKLAEVDA